MSRTQMVSDHSVRSTLQGQITLRVEDWVRAHWGPGAEATAVRVADLWFELMACQIREHAVFQKYAIVIGSPAGFDLEPADAWFWKQQATQAPQALAVPPRVPVDNGDLDISVVNNPLTFSGNLKLVVVFWK